MNKYIAIFMFRLVKLIKDWDKRVVVDILWTAPTYQLSMLFKNGVAAIEMRAGDKYLSLTTRGNATYSLTDKQVQMLFDDCDQLLAQAAFAYEIERQARGITDVSTKPQPKPSAVPTQPTKRYVKFGMYWECYGQQKVELPPEVPNDEKAIKKYLNSIWNDISLPNGNYVDESDHLDEDVPFDIVVE